MTEVGVLEVDAVTKSYPGPTGSLTVLDGVSLRLAPGQRLSIMGPSGSGKSTLLAVIGGLEPPSAGVVRLDGVDPHGGDAATRAAFRNRRVGFVFQEHHLLGGCTALDNVLLPALAQGRVPTDLVVRGRHLLDRVGLTARADHRPAELSGGERQRVAVARALLLSPHLLLADEPTGQLDARSAADVGSLLLELAAEAGGMLIVATHSEALAARVGSVRQLRDGRLQA
ncbi:MAG: ABC transporter ATP-binding protein [Planctomycetota bacterium]|jgi:lipoprotein-releasing system ATP-binding protein|nr:MAG: ABC transporter ATP-binding protein [Planctomycetota bacterium]